MARPTFNFLWKLSDYVAPLDTVPISSTRVVVSIGPGMGMRIYHRLDNGEINRNIEESKVLPSFDTFERVANGENIRNLEESMFVPSILPRHCPDIYILPKPTAEYQHVLPYDLQADGGESFRSLLHRLDQDGRFGIQNVEAFAAHPNGTIPLTLQLLPTELFLGGEHQYTLWCELTFTNGSTTIIKRNP